MADDCSLGDVETGLSRMSGDSAGEWSGRRRKWSRSRSRSRKSV